MKGNKAKGNPFRTAAAAAILAFGVGASPDAGAEPPAGLVVFGTSLSDPGNAYAILGEANTPPDWSGDMFLVPERPYARGGRHFSNGATWVEQMAGPLGLAASVNGAFTPGGGTNFAFGGARARPDSGELSPSLLHQVGAFLQATGEMAPANALYVIEMGGNDMRDALGTFASGGDPAPILDAARVSIGAAIQALYGAGARRFLVWNMPNIGLTPALRLTPLAGLANQLAVEFNDKLVTEQITPLLGMPDIQITVLDVHARLAAVSGSPRTFGLVNVTDACLSLTAPFACAQPNDHLFWDGIHPSAAGHAILAHAAAAALGR